MREIGRRTDPRPKRSKWTALLVAVAPPPPSLKKTV